MKISSFLVPLTRPSKNSLLAASVLLACAASLPHASAAIYTYTTTNTSENWSSGSNWSGVPVSDPSTSLIFNALNTTVLPNALINTNTLDIGAANSAFQLNSLTLQATGPASGTDTININATGGRYLEFVNNGSTTPVVTLNALKGSGTLVYNVNAPVTLTNNTLFTGNGTATFNFAGALSGSGNFSKAGSSTLTLQADSSSTYSGAINIQEGTVVVAALTGGKLSSSTILNFQGGGTFSHSNATGGPVSTQTLAQVNFQSGQGNLDINRPGGGNTAITVTSLSRSTGATGSFTVSNGSAGTTARFNLTGQTPNTFISQAYFFSGNSTAAFAFYDTGGYVRAMNFTSDSVAQSLNADATGTSSIGSGGLGVANKHTLVTGAAGTSVAFSSGGASGSNTLTLASPGTFQIGQTLSGTGVVKGTYITAISGSQLTLSQNLSAQAAGSYVPYLGINNQSSITLNTLSLAALGTSLTLAPGQTLTLSDAGIYYTGNFTTAAAIISGGTGILPGAGKELVINTSGSANNMITLATPILNNGGNALIKTGAGTLRLEASNTLNNGLYVNQGLLEVLTTNTIGTGIYLSGNTIVNIKTATASLGAGSTTITSTSGVNYIGLNVANSTLPNNILVESGTLNLYSGLPTGGGAITPSSFTGNITINAGAALNVTKGSGSSYSAVGNGGTSLLTFGANADANTVLTLGGFGSTGGARSNFAGISTSTVVGTGPKIKNKDGANTLDLRVTVAPATSYTFAGTIEDNTSLTKQGNGTQILSGNNTYTSTTTVSAGKLIINGNQSAATGAVSVASTATLGGSGTIGGAVSVVSGGTIAPGNSIGTLTIANTLTLAGIGYFEISPSSSDKIIGLTATPTISGSITADFASGAYSAGNYDLITWAGGGTLGATPTLNIVNPGNISGFAATLVTSSAGKLVLNLASTGGTPNFIFTDTSDVTLNVLKNSSGISTTKTIQNNGSAAGDASLNNTNTNLAVSGNLININSPSGTSNQTLSAFDTSNYDTDSGTLTVTPNTGGSNVINTTVNVGFATTGGNHTLGTALTASVANSGSYANLASKTTAGTETGGHTVLGTEAIILEGTNTSGSTATISEQWRTRTTAELTPGNAITGGNGRYLGSDVLDITGIAGTPVLYTLQMSYDSSDFADDAAEIAAAQNGFLYLAWLNGSNLWVNAGDTGAYTTPDINGYQTGTDFALGKWGINATTNTVWAVVNHNSEFAAVVPEPASLSLLALGTLPLLTRRRRTH